MNVVSLVSACKKQAVPVDAFTTSRTVGPGIFCGNLIVKHVNKNHISKPSYSFIQFSGLTQNIKGKFFSDMATFAQT